MRAMADPARAKVRLGDYARIWIIAAAGAAAKDGDLYRWLLASTSSRTSARFDREDRTQLVREWRAPAWPWCFVDVAAKAYRLLRAVLMTAVEDDKIIAA